MDTKIFLVALNKGGRPHVESHRDHEWARKAMNKLKRWPEHDPADMERYDHVFAYIGQEARFNRETKAFEVVADEPAGTAEMDEVDF